MFSPLFGVSAPPSAPMTLAQLEALLDPIYAPIGALPWTIDIDPTQFLGSTGTPPALTGSTAASLYAGYMQMNNDADAMYWDIAMGAGTWTFELLTVTATVTGIAGIYLDGVLKATVNTYDAAGVTYNVSKPTPGIVVATTGKKRLTVQVDGKDAASGGFTTIVAHLQLRRTA